MADIELNPQTMHCIAKAKEKLSLLLHGEDVVKTDKIIGIEYDAETRHIPGPLSGDRGTTAMEAAKGALAAHIVGKEYDQCMGSNSQFQKKSSSTSPAK